MIRTAWAWANGALATLLIGAAVIVASQLRLKGAIYAWSGTAWSRWILWASGVRVVAEGSEHIACARPQIIVANHQSWFDVFALATNIPKRYLFLAKRELEAIPVFGTAWKAAGHISIDRTDRASAIRSLNAAAEQLRQDRSAVVIFPEGTRSPDGRLLPFKKGAFRLALHSGVEIVPAAVSRSREVLPRGRWRIHPGTIIVRFGPPVVPSGAGPEAVEALMANVRNRVSALRDGDRPPAVPAP